MYKKIMYVLQFTLRRESLDFLTGTFSNLERQSVSSSAELEKVVKRSVQQYFELWWSLG